MQLGDEAGKCNSRSSRTELLDDRAEISPGGHSFVMETNGESRFGDHARRTAVDRNWRKQHFGGRGEATIRSQIKSTVALLPACDLNVSPNGDLLDEE